MTAPPFTKYGLRWDCIVTADGSGRYEWRAGALTVWRDGRTFRARGNGREVSGTFPTLLAAMRAAQNDWWAAA